MLNSSLIIHINYIPLNIKKESLALQKYILTTYLKKDNLNEIKQVNKNLFMSLQTQQRIILWFPVQILFDPIFDMELKKNELLRKSLSYLFKKTNYTPINEIWLEYLLWLDFYSHKDIYTEQQIKTNLLYFFLQKNNNFPSKLNKKILKNNLLYLNPFIKYWYDCYNFLTYLRLPKDLIVLPEIHSIDFLNKLRNKTKLSELYGL